LPFLLPAFSNVPPYTCPALPTWHTPTTCHYLLLLAACLLPTLHYISARAGGRTWAQHVAAGGGGGVAAAESTGAATSPPSVETLLSTSWRSVVSSINMDALLSLLRGWRGLDALILPRRVNSICCKRLQVFLCLSVPDTAGWQVVQTGRNALAGMAAHYATTRDERAAGAFAERVAAGRRLLLLLPSYTYACRRCSAAGCFKAGGGGEERRRRRTILCLGSGLLWPSNLPASTSWMPRVLRCCCLLRYARGRGVLRIV